MTTQQADHNKLWTAGLIITLIGMLGYLVHRSAGVNPAVFADEWYYSKFSRLTALPESILPSYLYLWIMRGTSVCGTGFLECSRIINSVVFVAAAPFIYGIARSFTSRPLAVWVAILSTALPIGSVTTYFMPESLYYCGFCLLSWYVLTQSGADRRLHACFAGVVLGLLSLVKVHALFLLPALWLYVLFLNASGEKRPRLYRNALLLACISAAATLLTKFGVGYLIVGKAGLSLFGSFYASTADVAKPTSLMTLATMVYINGRGHVMAMLVLFAVPLATIANSMLTAIGQRRPVTPTDRLHFFTFLMLGSAFGMTVMYTASIAKLGPAEVLRLHMRYYDFVFPLLLVVTADAVRRNTPRYVPALAWSLATLAAAVLLFVPFRLPNYVHGHVDAPELTGLAVLGYPLYAAIAMGILMLVLWARNSKAAPALFLFLFVPATAILTETRRDAALQPLVSETQFDVAGKFIRDTIPVADRKDLTVIGSGVGQLMRVMFYVDNKDADYLDLPYGAPITHENIPLNKRWVLVIAPHAIPEGYKKVVSNESYSLLETGGQPGAIPGTTMMRLPLSNGAIVRTEGLAEPESMGRWSNGKQVVLHLQHDLPRNVTMVLHAAAFGPNVGKPFTVRAGSAVEHITLAAEPKDVAVQLHTDGSVNQITIDVPAPTSPQSVGPSSDTRTVGIMLGAVTFKLLN